MNKKNTTQYPRLILNLAWSSSIESVPRSPNFTSDLIEFGRRQKNHSHSLDLLLRYLQDVHRQCDRIRRLRGHFQLVKNGQICCGNWPDFCTL